MACYSSSLCCVRSFWGEQVLCIDLRSTNFFEVGDVIKGKYQRSYFFRLVFLPTMNFIEAWSVKGYLILVDPKSEISGKLDQNSGS